MDRKKLKYWSEHPIIAEVVAAIIIYFLGFGSNEVVDRYFSADTVSTFIDTYLVETGYVDDSILSVESPNEQFQIIYNSFVQYEETIVQYEETIKDTMVTLGENQEEVSKMERAALLSELPYLADATVKSNSDKDKEIKGLNETINTLTTDNKNKQNEIDELKKRKEADLKQSHLIIDGELMNNGDSVPNAVAIVDGNNYYSESLLNTHLYPDSIPDKILYDMQENVVVFGNAKPEKVRFSWDDMVFDPDVDDVYKMGSGRSFDMAKNSYTEGLVLMRNDYFYAQLRGQYSKMTFTYGHVDNTEQSDLELKIYALDENGETYTRLLKTITLKGEMIPKDVEVPLGYVSAIKIVVSDGSKYPRFGLTNIHFYS